MSILFADGRSIEEALGQEIYDEAKHPRGRGGKWVAVLGRIASLHKDLGGHPGVQNRLDRGHMTAGDMTRVRSFAGKQDGEAAAELRRLATEVQAHMRDHDLTSMRPTAGGRESEHFPQSDIEGYRQQFARDADVYRRHGAFQGQGKAEPRREPPLRSASLSPGDRATRSPGGERHASVLFAQHRGGGSGLVPGRGVTRMQPDEQRAATRMSPGGERGKTFSPGDRVQHRDGGQGKVTGDTTNGRVPVKFDDGSRDPSHVFSVKPEELESLSRPKALGGSAERLAPEHHHLIDTFEHRGPGGDRAMPSEVRSALESIKPGEQARVGGIPVGRHANGEFNVAGDANLASPWVAMQSLRDARAEKKAGRSPWVGNSRKMNLKPGSKMSRRQGHDLVIEAVVEAVRREFGK